MCYWVGTHKVKEAILNYGKGKFLDESIQRKLGLDFQERPINIARSNAQLTILKKEKEQYTFDNYHWSLKWTWEKNGKINDGKPIPNIRDKKAVWRHKTLLGTNNCILPIRGYIEFHHQDKEKYPFWIFPKDGQLLFAAGLYNDYVDRETGEITKTFGLLTTDPNERISVIHNNPDRDGSRMLVLVPPEKIEEYLDPEKGKNILSFCIPYPADKLSDYPIRHFLRKENRDIMGNEAILEPEEYPELKIA